MSEKQEEVSIWKGLGVLVVLFAGGALIYILPYLKGYYYIPFMKALNVNNTQIGVMGSAYGIAAMVSYILGGWLADRVSARKLLTISFILTGLGGLYLATYPPYPMVVVIHVYWGVTTILTFWPALIKATRMLAAMNEQGKAFGFLEGGRGITNAVIMSLVLLMFARLGSGIKALNAVICTYSIMVIAIGVITWFVLKDNEREVSQGIVWDDLIKVLKMPHTWLITLIIFCSYSMNMSFYYITPFTTQVFGGSVVLGAIMTIMAQYARPIACGGAGILGDKIGSSKVIFYGFILMLAGLLGLILMPGSKSLIFLLAVFAVAIYASMYAIQAMHYALLEEGDYSLATSGMAVGVVATLGYLPEVLIPFVGGHILDAFPGALGYRYLFAMIGVLAVIGFIVVLYWMKITENKRSIIMAKNKAKANLNLEESATTVA